MKKLLFIAHEFHKKSKSYEFLVQLLEPQYDITLAFLPPAAFSAADCLAEFEGSRFEVILGFQILPPAAALRRFAGAQAVFFPMHDHSGRWGIEQWLPYRRLRIISFSRAMAQNLQRWGFDAHYFQFFPKPEPGALTGSPQKAFFWNRTERITLQTVAALLDRTEVKSIHLHKGLDPGQRDLALEPAVAAKFNLAVSTWFDSKQEMKDKIQECSLYFAPRLFEGIGLSFLEAMALGRCVIAPDRPTMNEYIVHGKTGFLYDPKRPAPLPLPPEAVVRIQQQTRDYMTAGYARWVEQRALILPLLEAPVQASGWKPWAQLGLRFLLHPLKATRSPRKWLISVSLKRTGWRVQLLGWHWSNREAKAPE